MKSAKGKTIETPAWVGELKGLVGKQQAPAGWISNDECADRMGIHTNTARRYLQKIEDESIVMVGKRGKACGRFYNWPKLQEMLGL